MVREPSNLISDKHQPEAKAFIATTRLGKRSEGSQLAAADTVRRMLARWIAQKIAAAAPGEVRP